MNEPNVILSSEIKPKPLRDGKEVSWMNQSPVGNDQGMSGACSVFALTNWLAVMRDQDYSDMECIRAFEDLKERAGIKTRGVTVQQAFKGLQDTGWFSDVDTILPVQDLDALTGQPLIAVYDWDSSWIGISNAGCLDADGSDFVEGQHCVLTIARGQITTRQSMVYIQNSYGNMWGHKGCAMMTEKHHDKIIRELWAIV